MVARRKKGMENRVYSYAARIEEDLPLALDILRKANAHRNQLVEIELARRKAYGEACEMYSPGYIAAHAVYLRLSEEWKVAKKGDSKEEKKRIRAELKRAKADIIERKSALELIPEFNAKVKEFDKEAASSKRLARANSQLLFGTYLEVEAAAASMHSGTPPTFRKFDRDGNRSKIGIQINDGIGMRPAKIFDSSNRQFWINPSNLARLPLGNGQWSEPMEVKNPWRDGKFRVGSNPDRTPIWLRFRAKLHRPLPEDAMIKRIWLIPVRIGMHLKWRLQFVLEKVQGQWAKPLAEDGVVALHFGWSKEVDGVVAARWLGSDGYKGSIVIPNTQLDRYAYCSKLKGTIDKEFNACLAVINEAKPRFSETLQEEFEFSGHWKSPMKLLRLIVTQSEALQAVGGDFYQTLCAWRKQHKHLYDWMCLQRQGVWDWRTTYYRTVVAQFRSRYRTAVFPDLDLKKLQELDNNSPSPITECRRSACLHLLKEELVNTMETNAVSENVTDFCGACGKLIAVVCSECQGKSVRKKKKATPGQCRVCGTKIPDHCVDCAIPRRDSACLSLLRCHWKDTPEKLDAFFRARGLTNLLQLGGVVSARTQ